MYKQTNQKRIDFENLKLRFHENLNMIAKSEVRFLLGKALYEKYLSSQGDYTSLLIVVIDSLFESCINLLWCFYDPKGQCNAYLTMKSLENYSEKYNGIQKYTKHDIKGIIRKCKIHMNSQRKHIKALKYKRNKETAHRDDKLLEGCTFPVQFDTLNNLLHTASKVLTIISSIFSISYFGYDIKLKQYRFHSTYNVLSEFEVLCNSLKHLELLRQNLGKEDEGRELLLTTLYQAFNDR